MRNDMIFKTRISYSYILSILVISFFATQLYSFIKKDFFNKTSWWIFGFLMVYVFIFNLLFVWSFELHSTYIKVNYSFFLRPAKLYSINDIAYIRINYVRGKFSWPILKIKIKDKEIIHNIFIISKKSLRCMISRLKEMNVDANIVKEVNE
jgi:hypothetical protein